jgi:thiamine-phosphate pyrophosphorylase
MGRPPVISGLYAITPDCADTRELLSQVRQALSGGARILQYRNKPAGASLRLEQAGALRGLTREFGIPLVVNDDVDLAQKVGADGVHLGAADADAKTARRVLGGGKIIGVSCYNRLSLARQAVAAGANYVAFGSFFPSGVKPDAVKAEPELLHRAREEFALPLVAIGGITALNGASLLDAGADALAVISALFGAADIQTAAQDFSKLFIRNTAP